MIKLQRAPSSQNLLDEYLKEVNRNTSYSLFDSKIPYDVTFYSKNEDSTFDGNLDAVVHISGDESFSKYTKIENLPVFFNSEFGTQIENGDFGNEVEIDIEAVIPPNLVAPQVDDFIKILAGDTQYLLRISDVQVNSLDGLTYFQVSMDYANETIEDVNTAVTDNKEVLQLNNDMTVMSVDHKITLTAMLEIKAVIEREFLRIFFNTLYNKITFKTNEIEVYDETLEKFVFQYFDEYIPHTNSGYDSPVNIHPLVTTPIKPLYYLEVPRVRSVFDIPVTRSELTLQFAETEINILYSPILKYLDGYVSTTSLVQKIVSVGATETTDWLSYKESLTEPYPIVTNSLDDYYSGVLAIRMLKEHIDDLIVENTETYI